MALSETRTAPLPQRQERNLAGSERAKTNFYYTLMIIIKSLN